VADVPRALRAAPETDAAESPWRLGGLGLRGLTTRVWQEIGDDEIVDRAAALSYYFVFALFPMLLFLAALLGMVPDARLMDQLMGYLAGALPPDAASLTSRVLNEIVSGAHGGLVSVGALAALWAASAGMDSIRTALNAAYDVVDPRPWWKRRLMAIGLTIVFAGFTLTGLILLVLGPEITDTIARSVGLGAIFTAIWNTIRWPVALILALVGVGLVYYLAPAVRQRWYWVTPGSAVAVAGWLLASSGLRLYVTRFADFNATYGSIGGAMLLLLWLYMTGLMLLVGAEVNAEIAQAARQRARAVPDRERRTA
jgi:membrane protein